MDRRPRARAWLLLPALVLALSGCAGGQTSSPGGGSPSSGAATGASVAPTASAAAGATDAATPSAAATDAASAEPSGTDAASPTASGGAASPGASGGFVPNPDVSGDLTTLFLNYETGDEVAKSRIDAFRAAYPNVNLTVTEGGFDPQAFQTALASGSADVALIPRDVFGTYAATEAIQPLDEMIAASGLDTGVFQEAAMAQLTLDGKIYGLPEFYDTRLLIINNALVQEAGLTIDDISTRDWDRLREIAKQLTKGDGDLTQIGFDPKLPEFLPVWAAANGTSLLSEDGRTSNLDDPKVLEALQFAASIIEDAGGAARFNAFKQTWDPTFFSPDNPVAANQLGFWPMEEWYVNFLAGASPNVDITVKPMEDRQGNPITYQTGSAWAVMNSAKNPEAAFEFARFMTSADTMVLAAQARADLRAAEGEPNLGIYPANKEATERIFRDIVKPSGKKGFDDAVQAILDSQESAISIPASAAGQEFETAWKDAVNAVLNEGADPAEALREADEIAQEALDRANE